MSTLIDELRINPPGTRAVPGGLSGVPPGRLHGSLPSTEPHKDHGTVRAAPRPCCW
jgi:hypothetical protein